MATNTGVVYGATGTYKTVNLGFLAKSIFAKTKKRVRLITTDTGGGAGGCAPIQDIIDAGIIEVLNLVNDPSRLLLLSKIVEGYWPKNIINGVRQDKKMLDPENLKDIGGYFFQGITSIAESIHELYVGRNTGMNVAYSEKINSD